MRAGTGALEGIYLPGTAPAPTALLENAMERLRALAAQPRVTVTTKALDTRDLNPIVWSRLHAFGEMYQLGQVLHFRLADSLALRWTLPPTYLAFLERWGSLKVVVEDAPGCSFEVLGPLSAAHATNDLWEALHDHREEGWPYEDPVRYGFAECVVFASVPRRYLTGWAFDTRVGTEGESAIRRVVDFSGDDGAEISSLWPLSGAGSRTARTSEREASSEGGPAGIHSPWGVV
ncbi:MAG: hypothetical protein AAGE52_35035 [Myxococcota bacterium]